MTNGAQALLETLVEAGIEICFANPGTSEMHLVNAIGRTDVVRPVLGLFEGVVSGAADGYARMTGRPAVTLLHLGPGFANAMANLHNARKARSPIVNIVGDHATHHLQYETPLKSDVPAHARLVSDWVRIAASADDLAASGALAVQAALQGAGRIATLVAPANHAWEPATGARLRLPAPALAVVPAARVEEVAARLRNGKRTALVLGGKALREDALEAAGRCAAATGARLVCETFPARLQRGAGRVPVERLPYFAERAIQFLADCEQLVLVGAHEPVAFFAYPGVPSRLAPDGCEQVTLATADEALADALTALAAALAAPPAPLRVQPRRTAPPPGGVLTPAAMGRSIAGLLPPGAIVADESITCGLELFVETEGAAPHDWLTTTGGSIGDGLPVALGAALACPDRKVVALQSDGGAMYTAQALWTMAREQADVTVVLLNNRSYAILNIELMRLRAGMPNDKTLSMLSLDRPAIDWLGIAAGMQVPASRAMSADEFHAQFAAAMRAPGPHLIEARVVQEVANIFSR